MNMVSEYESLISGHLVLITTLQYHYLHIYNMA